MMSVLKPRLQNTDADEQRLSQTPASLTESKENFFFKASTSITKQKENLKRFLVSHSTVAAPSRSGSLGFH